MTKLKYVVVALAGLFCASAHAQSSPPPICHLGSPCVVDSKGTFVGVGSSGPVMHVFDGKEYMIIVESDGLVNKGGTPFSYTTSNCSGQPYLNNNGTPVPQVAIEKDGTLYADKLPFTNITVGSFSVGLTGSCIPTSGTAPFGAAYVVDDHVAKSWVPPFSAYKAHP
jgi:hypothetical protein